MSDIFETDTGNFIDIGEELYNQVSELIYEKAIYKDEKNFNSELLSTSDYYYNEDYDSYICFRDIPTLEELSDTFSELPGFAESIYTIMEKNMEESYGMDSDVFIRPAVMSWGIEDDNKEGIAVDILLEGIEYYCYEYAEDLMTEE